MTANSNNILIGYQKATEILNQIATGHSINSVENIALSMVTDRVLAQEVISPINVPSFNNSAMDGFAVQSHVVNKSIEEHGKITLEVTGTIQAGDASDIEANHKHLAWEIMTGAPIPNRFDAVIQIENIVAIEINGKKHIEIKEHIKKGRNIRKKGTDYRINENVVGKHVILQSQHIMALATVGVKNVDVIEKVKVAILSTGNELAKKSSTTLNSGKIFNSNQPFLESYSQNLNCDPVFVGRCKDNRDDFNLLIDDALAKEVKIIFSTGAVSMGKYDFIPQTLLQRGAKIYFHKAKIRPGKPILFAELPNGIIYFGLPGNPIAAAAGMRFFVSPFVRTMLGLKAENKLKAQLQSDIEKKEGFRTFAKAKAFVNTSGQVCVDMLLDQGSYQSCSFAQSNCWLILPEDRETIKAGEIIEIAPMIPNHMVL
jgi:molybdopterin molybdotransferase